MPPSYYPKLPTGTAAEKKGRIRKGYLTVTQLKLVIDGEKDLQRRLVFKLLYFCAMRASEVGLQPFEHFVPSRRSFDVVRLKRSMGRTYLLEPWVLRDMTAWAVKRPEGSPFLFCHPKNISLPLDRFNVFRWWREAVERVGLDVELFGHPHVLKHTIGTHMFERGNSVEFVRDWMGHKRIENTLIYAELTGKMLSQGQAVMVGLTKELS